ncbi:MAG: bifunctional metallophosphatase/5'-nucleotidase [Oscillospiraceae bacterium]|nr:bifunctional metallophosphatase/5'-nucleotidase [Oscillospiraceae bacterium]
MVIGLMAPLASAAEEDHSEDIAILYTNDVHTYIDKDLSYDSIAALKTYLEGLYKDVILVDAGDHIQGTAYGSMDKGATIIELMNASGYDLATLGNHEFDYGMDGAMNVIEWANYPYVSANFYHEADGVKGESVLDAYKIFEVGDEKIAFVGITTPESFTKSTPAYFQDENGNYIYGISGGTDGADLQADVQAAVDAAKQAGATKVIALGHLGDDPASQPWTSEETIANVTGLDAFIDGHSHSTVPYKEVADKAGSTVVLTQTGEYFNAIGMMVIKADGTITSELLTALPEGVTPDADVAAIKDAWIEEISTQLGEVIGSTDVVFDNYDEEGKRLVRSQETNTGDFAADALYYLFDNMGLDVDFAIMNGGGVRNQAVTGEISYLTCKSIHTFGNVACLQTVTGQQILDALEWGARGAPAEVGGFMQVSGLTYEIDLNVESTVQADDKGVWTGGPTGEYRVKNVKVYNKETGAWDDLDLTAHYNLAGYNYTLRDLGDGYAMFDGAVNVLDYVMEDYMVLANYVQGFENGAVSATNSPLAAKYEGFTIDYGTVNGSGRIKLVEVNEQEPEEPEEPEEPTEPVDPDGPAATGDVSIVMYVGMAIASLWGTAAVIKKKEF